MTKKRDNEALELAVAKYRARDSENRPHLAAIIKDRGWRKGAEFAAFAEQMVNLHLRPCEFPPCWINEPYNPPNYGAPDVGERDLHGIAQAAGLCRRMNELKISLWHPDPRAAIAAAEGAAGASAG